MGVGNLTALMTDVVVIGGGPAGAATAIAAANNGLSVTLLEQKKFPRHRPGETLHPGAEALFQKLGVRTEVASASGVRHEGIKVGWPGPSEMQPYGRDEGGVWRGYQISRDVLDEILINKARNLGVEVRQPCRAHAAIRSHARVVGVETSSGDIYAKLVVDAGGALCWINRQNIVGRLSFSPKLLARYGYCDLNATGLDRNPSLIAEDTNWLWLAPISDMHLSWTQLIYPSERFRKSDKPTAINGLKPIGNVRGADVTWRLALPSAQCGVIAVGDAASIHDPLSSHGVINAMMSGILVGTLAKSVVSARKSFRHVAETYSDWVKHRFIADSAHLIASYQQLPNVPEWVASAARQLNRLC